ncbi:MAG: sulfur globule protein precursor [Pseudorhodoplanes sp.]|nr:sulfur globule protein precursor [Pseudorhodoplanes sp.]
MLRRIVLVGAAALALGALGVPQAAFAKDGKGWHGGGHGWHGGKGWHGGWHGGGWRHFGWRRGWYPGYFYRAPYVYGAYAGCIRWRQVPTPWGYRWRKVNVCY